MYRILLGIILSVKPRLELSQSSVESVRSMEVGIYENWNQCESGIAARSQELWNL